MRRIRVNLKRLVFAIDHCNLEDLREGYIRGDIGPHSHCHSEGAHGKWARLDLRAVEGKHIVNFCRQAGAERFKARVRVGADRILIDDVATFWLACLRVFAQFDHIRSLIP